MKRTFINLAVISLTLIFNNALPQVQTLDLIGQTHGGGGYTVTWDASAEQLIVGCGTSVWVYDMTDPYNPVKVKKRPLLGMINETILHNGVLYVAATSDGVYALDFTSVNLDILSHFSMKEMPGVAAYGMHLYNDTIYVADNSGVRMLIYDAVTGFTDIGSFGADRAFGVHRRGDYIAVCCQQKPLVSQGKIQVFAINNLATPVAEWNSPWIDYVQAIQWADLRDDIIYVCGGPETALFTKSNFFALQFDSSGLLPIDTFSVTGGVPGIAQLNIINMDSRNDTLLIATTAAWDITHLPFTYIPIVDASGLPQSKMVQIGKVCPGLWHFDVALMHGTPYVAMSSEWMGVVVSDISAFAFMDTVKIIPTGGWVKDCKVKDNKLWVCNEGYGMIVYDIDSLLFDNGFWCDATSMHIHDLSDHFFSSSIEFLNDTLIILNTSRVYNIKPWQLGGAPVLLYDMNKPLVKMKNIRTNVGQRMVATSTSLLNNWLFVFDPYDAQNHFANFFLDTTRNTNTGFTVSGDTLYYGKKIGNQWFLIAAKVENDAVTVLDSIQVTMPWGIISHHDITGISVENDLIAISYGKQLALFRWNNNELEELFCDYNFNRAAKDIVLRNNYIYVADQFFGMKVYDVSSLSGATLVAQTRGSGGWMNVFGSVAITLGDDNRIYLSDFNAGIIIIEPFDPVPIGSGRNNNNPVAGEFFSIFPNPADQHFTIRLQDPDMVNGNTEVIIHDITGKILYTDKLNNRSSLIVNTITWKAGFYFVNLAQNGIVLSTAKLLIH